MIKASTSKKTALLLAIYENKILVMYTNNVPPILKYSSQGMLVGTFLISAKMFLIPCVLWAISGTISNMFLIPNNIRNNLSVPDIMRESFYNNPNIAMPILTL